MLFFHISLIASTVYGTVYATVWRCQVSSMLPILITCYLRGIFSLLNSTPALWLWLLQALKYPPHP